MPTVANMAIAAGPALLEALRSLVCEIRFLCNIRIQVPEAKSQKGVSILYTCYTETVFPESTDLRVRQGVVLSPYLFAVYLHDFSNN